MPTEREELIVIQKRLVEELKENIYDTVGRHEPALDRYYREYQSEFKPGFERVSSRDELIQRLMRADIAYFGDYHTLRSAQTAVLDLLQGAAERGRKVVLALEMLHAADKTHSHDLIEGDIDEETFRWRVKWDESWGFPWGSYKRFFEFSRRYDAPLFGININADYAEGGLHYRDRFAADLVSALTHLYPERLVAVVYGDLHLAGQHLPQEVEDRLAAYKVKRRSIRVYQNSETVYWQLVAQRLEHVVDYVKLKRDAYVVMNATPLVKFQSYANWQHKRTVLMNDDDASWDIDLFVENALVEQVHQYVVNIADFLGIKLEETANFEVYTAADLDLLSNMVKRGVYTADEMKLLRDYVAMAESAFFERARVLYIGNFTVANAAEAAGRYILAELRPAGSEPVDERDEFYGRCMVEALAYFCSKIIDPRRHARNLEEWAHVAGKFSRRRKLGRIDQLDLTTARGFLAHRAYEDRVLSSGRYHGAPRSLFSLPTDQHVALTRALGRALGDRLYGALDAGISRQMIRDAMQDSLREPDRARTRYFQMLGLSTQGKTTRRVAPSALPRTFIEDE